MKISFDNLTFPNSRNNYVLFIFIKKKKRKKEKLKRNWLEVWVILNASLSFQLNSVRVILHLAGWVKIKYLHLIRWEDPLMPAQVCQLGHHWSWNRVVIAKLCVWLLARRGVKKNEKVLTKHWTINWTPVDGLFCVRFFYLAHKRCQPSKIVERKDKRVGGFAKSSIGF